MGGEIIKFEIAPPASPAEVERMEKEIGRRLHVVLREVFLHESASIRIMWNTEEFTGSAAVALADMPTDVLNWSGWRDCFEHPTNYGWPKKMSRKVYESLFPFQTAANGDAIVFEVTGDDDGMVMYLDHERGEFDRVVLDQSSRSFVETWFRLGCPGPEHWELAPFYDYDSQKISIDTIGA